MFIFVLRYTDGDTEGKLCEPVAAVCSFFHIYACVSVCQPLAEFCCSEPGISGGPSSEVRSSSPERTDLYVKMAAVVSQTSTQLRYLRHRQHRAACWTLKDASPNLLPADVFPQSKAV